MTLRSNTEVFMRALFAGNAVEYRKRTYKLIPAGEDINCPSGVYTAEWDVLVTLGVITRGDDPPEPIMMPCDFQFNTLTRMCGDMTEEERFSIISSAVLMAENTTRR